MKKGKVYLVGAGPGDPGLFTLKGKRVMERADVVIYDRLLGTQILSLAPKTAERIFAGKASGSHTIPQEEINRLLVEKAEQGKTVVRLKGGDPFLFGRGGEEALFLVEYGIDFEVVPGVSSAIAAPACAGIPVTHRDLASSFAAITGHEKPGKKETSVNWKALASGVDTLVFLMGVENLPFIVGQLIDGGKTPDTPAALIRYGSLPRQQVVTGTLTDIVQKAKEADLRPPAVFIAGAVVSLREKLSWAEKLPLWGKRILVTRPEAQALSFAEKIYGLGGEPVLFPTVEIVKEPDLAPLHAAFKNSASYDWIIFTSVNAVEIFFAELALQHVDIRSLKGIRLCAIGPETQDCLVRRGLTVDVVPEQFRAEGLLDAIKEKLKPGQKVLLPRARNARPVLPEGLKMLGAQVDEVFLYSAALPENSDTEILKELAAGNIDVITFTSSSTVTNFLQMLRSKGIDASACLQKTAIACIGPVTAATAKSAGLTVSIEAEEYTIDGLLSSLLKHVK